MNTPRARTTLNKKPIISMLIFCLVLALTIPSIHADLFSNIKFVAQFENDGYENISATSADTINGITYTSQGKKGNAAIFNAETDYISFSTIENNLDGAEYTGFTLTCWVNKTWTTAQEFIYRKGSGGTNSYMGVSHSEGTNKIYTATDTSTAATELASARNTSDNNKWVLWTHTWNADTDLHKLYINGIEQSSTSKTGNYIYDTATPFIIGNYDGSQQDLNGQIDECYIFNATATTDELLILASGNATSFYPFTTSTPASSPSITINSPNNNTAQHSTNNNITINTTANNYGGSITTSHYLYNSTGTLIQQNNATSATYTSTFTSLPIGTYYLNASATNTTSVNNTDRNTAYIYEIVPGTIINPANNTATEGQNQNITWTAATINPTGTGITISNYAITILNATGSYNQTINVTTQLQQYWDTFTSNLTPGDYWLQITAVNSQGYNISTANYFTLSYDADLNLTFKAAHNQTTLTTGSINLTDTTTSEFRILNTTTGNILAPIKKGDTYNITTNFPGYAISSQTYTSNQTTHQNQNISLYTNNSISILIYDENTGFIINQNITITFTGTYEQVNYTSNGSFYIDQLPDGIWTIKFQGTNYSLKQYTATIGARSHQDLNAYLTSTSQTTIFTILDFDSGSVIEGATFVQQRLIGGVWTITDTKSSDITGRVQTTYTPNIKYRFIITKTGYQSSTFDLDPILFSSYDVRLHKTTSLTPPTTPGYTDISAVYYPTNFTNEANHTLYFIITSPGGQLLNYNFSIQYPGGQNYTSGTNLQGETITENFQITNANLTSQVNITYCWTTTTSYPTCKTYHHAITGVYTGNTWKSNKNQTYGLGILERVLISTLLIVFIGGSIYAFLNSAAGLLVILFLIGYFYYIGFLSLWLILPGMLIGVLMIMRGDKNG